MEENKTMERIFLSPPHMGGEEMTFIKKVFESNYIAPLGPMVDAFEEEFAKKIGIGHTVAVSSGTAAMHLALRILGIGPDDEVIASTLTFIGGVTPILFQGARPVFIDCDRTSWTMNPDLLAKELKYRNNKGSLPKAVVPTDLYGQCADMDRIMEICAPYDIPVVTDSAEALGAQYLTQRRKDAKSRNEKEKSFLGDLGGFEQEKGLRHAGVGAKAAIFSFNGNKIITTSGGGMLASDDKALIEQAHFLSQQARDPAPHYEHSTFGYNYRMSNVVAAIGRGQLRVLDERVEAKRRIFAYYKKALDDLAGIEFMPEPVWSRTNRWLTVIVITPEEFGSDRALIQQALEEENIEARPVWKPMHLQPIFQDTECVGGEVAEDLFNHGLCLPSGTMMSEKDLDRVISVILRCQR